MKQSIKEIRKKKNEKKKKPLAVIETKIGT